MSFNFLLIAGKSRRKKKKKKKKKRYSEVLLDMTKEGQKNPMAVPANSQGNDLTMKGDPSFSGSTNKCLSVVEGKKRTWERLLSAVRAIFRQVGEAPY
jgi:hypothetical protein